MILCLTTHAILDGECLTNIHSGTLVESGEVDADLLSPIDGSRSPSEGHSPDKFDGKVVPSKVVYVRYVVGG